MSVPAMVACVNAAAEDDLGSEPEDEMTTEFGAQGERRPFERYVNELRPELHRYASWVCGDANLAEDAVQEALIRAWRSWDKLRQDSAVKSWLHTIVRRECARLFERKQPSTRRLDEFAERDERPVEKAAAEHDAAAAELQRAVMSLDGKYREPLLLQAVMGYSATEIARIVGIEPGAVLTRLCRARRKLLSSLQAL